MMLTFFVRVLGLVSTVVAYWCTFVFMDNIDKNPLATYGICGMAASIVLSFSVIYLINANKDDKK